MYQCKSIGICISVKVMVCESVYILARTKGTGCILEKNNVYSSGFLTMGSFDRTQTFELSPCSKLASYVSAELYTGG